MDIIGNEAYISATLEKIKSRRMHHAYIFIGPAGSGKKTLAYFTAAALCCLDRENLPCGHCNACIKAEAEAHPDIHILRKPPTENKISVDSVRQFVKDINITPNEADYKIYIIEDAQYMGKEAQNALLKTLEEPVGNSVFMLLSTSESAMLPTVRSRCVTVVTEQLPLDVITKHIEKKYGADADLCRKAARLSAGCLGVAYNAMEKSGAFEYRDTAALILDDLISQNKANAEARLLQKNITREKLAEIYSFLQLAMRDIAARNYGEVHGEFFDSSEDIRKARRRFTQSKAIALYDVLEKEKKAIALNGNPSLSVLRVISSIK